MKEIILKEMAMKKLLIVSLCLFLVGCATMASKMNKVSLGMTKEQVIEAMGQPVSISAKEGAEYLNYRFSETGTDSYYGWTSPYFVRIVDGKVESYGRLGDFDSTKTPTMRIETDEKIHSTSDAKGDMYIELKKLKELRDEKIITEEEFQREKKEILEKH